VLMQVPPAHRPGTAWHSSTSGQGRGRRGGEEGDHDEDDDDGSKKDMEETRRGGKGITI